MKRWISFIALSASLYLVTPHKADEPPHMELVRGLRAKNYPDLAMEYLKELAKKKGLPKEITDQLPLELARTQVEMAQHLGDGPQRATLFTEARQNLEAFLKANPTSPFAGEVKLDLARIVGAAAKVQFNKARDQAGDARRASMVSARAQFADAAKSLGEAETGIADLLAKDNKNAKLAQAKLDAEYEKGVNLLHLLLTYEGEKEIQDRNKVAAQVKNALEKLVNDNEKNETGWKARAWLLKYLDETDQFLEADAEYKKTFAKLQGGYVEPGKRMARSFLIQMWFRKDANGKEGFTEVTRHGNDWLTEYRSFANTPEGNAVRFALGTVLKNQADKDPKSKEAAEQYARAEKLFDELEAVENEFTERARTAKTDILLKRKPELLQTDLKKLGNFRECFVRAQLEIAQINNLEKQKPVDEKKVSQHQQNVLDVLNRGLELADQSNASVQERIDAKFLLVYYLMVTNKPYQAAVMGEELARKNPNSSRAGLAGGYALTAYSQAIEGEGKDLPNSVKAADIPARIKDLAVFIETNWKNDLAADAARHQLGVLALKDTSFKLDPAAVDKLALPEAVVPKLQPVVGKRFETEKDFLAALKLSPEEAKEYRTKIVNQARKEEKNYPAAIDAFSRVSPAYGLYSQVQFQLAMTALQALKDKVPPPKGKPGWQEYASTILEKISEPKTIDLESNRPFIYAKLQLAQIYFAAKKYEEMDKVVTGLKARLKLMEDKKSASPEDLKELAAMIMPMSYYAIYGRADTLYRSDAKDRFTKVRQMVDPIVDQLGTEMQKLVPLKNERAKIEPVIAEKEKEREKAKEDKFDNVVKKLDEEINKLAQQVEALNAKEKEVFQVDPSLFRALIGLALKSNVLDGQIDRAKKILDVLEKSAGDFENRGLILVDLVQQFTRQIEELDKKGDKAKAEKDKLVAQLSAFLDELAKQPLDKMKPEILRFLAFAYSGMAKHEQAAKLLDKVPEPGAAAKPDDEKFYYTVRLMLAREYRLSKKLDDASKIQDQLKKTKWGTTSLDLRKEEIHLLEAKDLYGAAANAWNKLIAELKKVVDRGGNPQAKDHYNEAFYHYVRCMYQFAAKNKDAKKREDYLNRAARLIVTLESTDQMGNMKEKYDDLLEKEAPLKAKVEEMRKDQPKTGAGGAAAK